MVESIMKEILEELKGIKKELRIIANNTETEKTEFKNLEKLIAGEEVIILAKDIFGNNIPKNYRLNESKTCNPILKSAVVALIVWTSLLSLLIISYRIVEFFLA